MIVYFDTSAIVPVVIEEPASEIATRLWVEADRVVSSRLVYAEGRAALAMACRMDRIDERGLWQAIDEFEILHEQLDLIEVTESLVRDAGGLAQQLSLRGYDAVHLASARVVADAEMVLAAVDQRLLTAAGTVGITTANLIRQP
ncbi:MAG: type II toxin-antitoxin system VapC family toxin [Dehalococcoidales bacterium]|nr:type II toxin-antitoxin system VapC family toxin [Dehalococcoidales bacterium]